MKLSNIQLQNLIRNFDNDIKNSNDLNKNKEKESHRLKFVQLFPKEKIIEMNLDDYIVGKNYPVHF